MAFLASLYKCTERVIALLLVLVLGVPKMFKFCIKIVFNVMGKASSGELSCTQAGLLPYRQYSARDYTQLFLMSKLVEVKKLQASTDNIQ